MPEPARSPARHRLLVILVIPAAVVSGFLALGRLPIEPVLSFEAPRLRVQVSVPGAPAAVIEEKVVRPLETALSDVAGVSAVESVATSGNAAIDLHLKRRGVMDAAQQDVATRLERARVSWSAAVEPPVVSRLDASATAAEFAITSRGRDLLPLRDWAESELARRLMELPGVAAVEMEGGAVREVAVIPDQRRLAGLGLAFDDVWQAIRRGPDAAAHATRPPARHRGRRVVVQSGGVAAVAAIPVMLPTGESVVLSEIARITLNEAAVPRRFLFDGRDAVKVTVQRRPSASMADVVERVQAHIEWMRANRLIPDGVEIHPFSRRLEEAHRDLRRIATAFAGGTVLALLAAYLLLGRGRQTLLAGAIAAVAASVSFVFMALAGLALDAMTLGALALGAGLFGSSAVWMLEGGVARAAATAAFVPVALLPLWWIDGATSAPSREFIFVFSCAWIISVAAAWWLVPAFDTRASRRKAPWHVIVHYAAERARRIYLRSLRRLLRRPATVLVIVPAVTGALIAALYTARQEYLPLSGSAPVSEMDLYLQGPDATQLIVMGDDFARRLRATPGWREVKYSAQPQETGALRLDEERARELGVEAAQVGRVWTAALTGISAGSFLDAERRYDVRLRLLPEESGSPEALGRVLLRGEWQERSALRLRDVATIERITAPAQIRRYDGVPTVVITLAPAEPAPPEAIAARVDETLREQVLPADYRLSYGHPAPAGEGKVSGVSAVGLALLFVLIVQALGMRSARAAALTIVTVLCALAGVGAALRLFDAPLSAPVWLSAAILIGIAASEAVMFAAYIEALRQRRPLSPETVLQAARHRFYPPLVMALMTIAGMVPLVLWGGTTAVLRPLVFDVAAGLLFLLAAGLYVAPLLCLFFIRAERSSTARRL